MTLGERDFTTNAAVLDISQTDDADVSGVRIPFGEGCVGRCPTNNTVDDWKLPAQDYGGESGGEDCQGEEHSRPWGERRLSEGVGLPEFYKSGHRSVDHLRKPEKHITDSSLLPDWLTA